MFDRKGSALFGEMLDLMGNIEPAENQSRFGPEDALLVIGMQRDYVPHHPDTNPHGGNFGIEEGSKIVPKVKHLIARAVEAEATVVAVRDYHPHDHVSFSGQGGRFPSHCVQGSDGAKFEPQIAEALADGIQQAGPERVFVAFKGLHELTESFGSFPDWAGGAARVQQAVMPLSCMSGDTVATTPTGGSKSPWTGSMVLKQSGIETAASSSYAAVDMDAPPDALAVLPDEPRVNRGARSLQEVLRGKKRLLVCGLPLVSQPPSPRTHQCQPPTSQGLLCTFHVPCLMPATGARPRVLPHVAGSLDSQS